MGALHPIRRIDALNRGNRACARQIESTISPAHRRSGTLARMTKSDPTLAQIAAQFTQFDVAKSRGGYMILDRRTSSPIARLRPIPDTDRFELFYWSSVKGRWTTFGNIGRMKLMLRALTRSLRVIRCSASRAADENWPKSSLEVVALMAERATNLVLRARLCDTCWLLDPKRAAFAVLAISSYVEVVQMVDQKLLTFQFQNDDQGQTISHGACDILRRALQIARKTGPDKQEAVAAKNWVATLRKRASSSGVFVSTLWFSNLDMDFGVSDPLDVANDIELVLRDGKKDDAFINVTVDLWSCAARAYNLAKKEDDKNRCQFEAAECLVLEAERQGSAMLASHWLNAAIRQLHGLPDKKDRRTELRHQLVDIQARIPEEMSEFSIPFDVNEIAERVREEINKATLLDKLLVFADLARSPDPAKLRDDAIKMTAKHPLAYIFGAAHLDSEGKVTHRTEGDDEGAIERAIAQSESIRRHLAALGSFEAARHAINAQYLISEEVLASLLRYSPFVPAYLLMTFSRGFVRFFQGDFISAIYILTPLLENSLRHVLKTHGHDVSNFDDAAGTQEDKTISALFEQMRSEMEAIFTRPVVADLEHVFLKKPGPCLRHGVAHGLLQDSSAFTADGIYACWLIFRLCCAPLFANKRDIEMTIA